MVRITMQYEGDLHCTSVHEPSSTSLATDAPRDNQGRGESFSPTDLVATALGTCILTTLAIVARNHSIELSGATASVDKEMTAVPTRRIGSLTTRIHIPQVLSDEHKQRLERAAHTCPVHKSLHPDVYAPIEFTWG